MTELERIYRQAPRQVSPDRLDDIVLARASQRVAGKKRSKLLMTPLKTLAVSFSVAGLAVALLFRNGVPPLEQKPLDSDRGIAGQVAKSRTRERESNSAEDLVVSTKQEASIPAAAVFSETDQMQLASPLFIEETTEVAQAPLPSAPNVMPSDSMSASVEVADDLSLTAADVAPAQRDARAFEVEAPKLSADALPSAAAGSLIDDSPVAAADSLEAVEESIAVDERVVARSRTAAPVRQSKKIARMVTPPVQTGAAATVQEQPVSALLPEQSRRAAETASIIRPPDSAAWVMNQTAQSFTLQLASAPSQRYLHEYAESLGLSQPLYIVALKTETQTPNFGLLFGVFENANQALDKIETLSSEARRFQPWVRRFGKLQNELRLP